MILCVLRASVVKPGIRRIQSRTHPQSIQAARHFIPDRVQVGADVLRVCDAIGVRAHGLCRHLFDLGRDRWGRAERHAVQRCKDAAVKARRDDEPGAGEKLERLFDGLAPNPAFELGIEAIEAHDIEPERLGEPRDEFLVRRAKP